MTDYQHIWGRAQKNWRVIDFKDKYVMNILLVWTWVSMIGFFVFAVFSIISRSNTASILMIASLLIWIGCGISIIRIKRAKRKYIMVLHK
jgi:hypothetical protein